MYYGFKFYIIDDEIDSRIGNYKDLYVELTGDTESIPDYANDYLSAVREAGNPSHDLYIVDLQLSEKWGHDADNYVILQKLAQAGKAIIIVSDKWPNEGFSIVRSATAGSQLIPMFFHYEEFATQNKRARVLNYIETMLVAQHGFEFIRKPQFRILQISDLHFGQWAESDNVTGYLISMITDDPDMIVISGDITNAGYPWEFQRAEEWIKQMTSHMSGFSVPSSRIVATPGNHDYCIPIGAASNKEYRDGEVSTAQDRTNDMKSQMAKFALTPFMQFYKRISGLEWAYNKDVHRRDILMRDLRLEFYLSCTVKYGEDKYIPSADFNDGAYLDAMRSSRKDDINRLRILVMHHPPTEVQESKYSSEGDLAPDLVLFGHKHALKNPNIYDKTLSIPCPILNSDPSKRDPNQNSGFNVIEIARVGSNTEVSVTKKVLLPTIEGWTKRYRQQDNSWASIG